MSLKKIYLLIKKKYGVLIIFSISEHSVATGMALCDELRYNFKWKICDVFSGSLVLPPTSTCFFFS